MPSASGDPNLGKNLKIALVAGGAQSDRDNVCLDAILAPVPEPAPMLMMLTGGLGLMGFKVWRKHRT